MIPFRTDAPSLGSPAITMTLIVANVSLYFYQIGLSTQDEINFIFNFALVPTFLSNAAVVEHTGLLASPYLSLITNTFMHGGALHLIFNMWTLWLFGAPLEDRLGHIPFLLFYLLCGTVGSYGHFYFNATSEIPALGASGAIAGVLGGYTCLFPKARVHIIQPIFFFPLVLPLPALLIYGRLVCDTDVPRLHINWRSPRHGRHRLVGSYWGLYYRFNICMAGPPQQTRATATIRHELHPGTLTHPEKWLIN
ncbi:MAG: rhomboid family intramembrane serine protease [Rhodospirillales bacterium]|jgi:membrane associated rhomboid family serine protease